MNITFSILKPLELFFISIIVVVVFLIYLLQTTNNWFELNQFPSEIFYAIITAILTTILFNVYSRYIKWRNNKKYIGIWQVCKFHEEDYRLQDEYVRLRRMRYNNDVLEYHETNPTNLNTRKGVIYISNGNENIGKLIYQGEWWNQIETIYPCQIKNIFFDETEEFTSNKKSPLIRIINYSGNEDVILKRPLNPKEFEQLMLNKYNSTIFKMST